MIGHGQLRMLQSFANSLDSLDGVKHHLKDILASLIIILNATDAVAQLGGTYASGSGPIWGSNIVCTGEEGRLVDCGFSSDTSLCTHSNDAGATCNTTGR